MPAHALSRLVSACIDALPMCKHADAVLIINSMAVTVFSLHFSLACLVLKL